MKPGTPGFVGERLREAREARGLSAVSLSDLLGVTRQAVSQYEVNRQTPSPETLKRISEVLKVPRQFFLKLPRQAIDFPVFYRSQSAATKSARTRAEARCNWFRDILYFVGRYIQLPKLNLPKFDCPDFTKLDATAIADAAAETRRHWGLGIGPISNVILLLENNGLIVVRHELGAETLDAFSLIRAVNSNESPVIVLGTDKASAVRSRFDACHELGHIILHQFVTEKDLANKTKFDQIENQANLFASAFLMPAESFCQDFYAPRLDLMRSLKPKWKVSIGAMISRAIDLNLVSKEEARRLWINRTQRGWRMREPLDDEMEPEEPRVVKRAFELLLSKGLISVDQLDQEISLSCDEIEILCGFPRGFLGTAEPEPELQPSILKFSRRF